MSVNRFRSRKQGHAHGPSTATKTITYAVLVIGLVAMMMPFIWMLLGAFKTDGEISRVPLTWLPEAPTLDNYVRLFTTLDLPRYLLNSVVVAGAVTLGNLVFSSMAGYALAKMDFRGKRALFLIVMGTLMVPGMVTFVPLFVMVANLNLLNTYAGLILPFLVTPFGVFLMRQFVAEIPDELLEAARLDGASELRSWARVVMPLCGPALATLAILTFVGSWNNFLWPMVAAMTEDMYTLPVGLALFSIGQHSTRYGLLMAGSTVVVAPVLAVFLMLQKHFTRGIATTGLK